jgi:hypothetical protein
MSQSTRAVTHRVQPEEKALELWAEEVKTDGVWTSAEGFPTEEVAHLFLQWLEKNDYAHQGIHGPHYSKACWQRLKETGVVRFR